MGHLFRDLYGCFFFDSPGGEDGIEIRSAGFCTKGPRRTFREK